MAAWTKQPAYDRGESLRRGWHSSCAFGLGRTASRFESKPQTGAAVLPDVMVNSIRVRAAGPPG